MTWTSPALEFYFDRFGPPPFKVDLGAEKLVELWRAYLRDVDDLRKLDLAAILHYEGMLLRHILARPDLSADFVDNLKRSGWLKHFPGVVDPLFDDTETSREARRGGAPAYAYHDSVKVHALANNSQLPVDRMAIDPETSARTVTAFLYATEALEKSANSIDALGQEVESLRRETEGFRSEVGTLKTSLSSERERAKDLESKWLRAVADFENYQRRIKRDLERDRQASFRRILGELVTVVDNVAILSENAAKPETTAESIVQAVDVGIKAEIMAIMDRNGAASMGVKPGDVFDPTRHEAVSVVDEEGPEKQDLVLSVLREGYTIGQSILRNATVVVKRVRPPKPAESPAQEAPQPPVGG